MNKNAKYDNMDNEIAMISKALEFARKPAGGTSVILAKMVKDLSLEKWNQARRNLPLTDWQAFPLAEGQKDPKPDEKLSVTPFRDAYGALTIIMFEKLLARELTRLERNGGCLSVLGIDISEKARLAASLGKAALKRLQDLLGNIILSKLDSCDSLSVTNEDQYLCSLPGLGQLAARNFAEKCQLAFEDAARPFFPAGGINAGRAPECAIGIVNVMPNERPRSEELIRRAKKTLEVALSRHEGYIHQETSFTPLEKTTLVQSQEKQFLFFGGDPS